jgi:hypothetical protein
MLLVLIHRSICDKDWKFRLSWTLWALEETLVLPVSPVLLVLLELKDLLVSVRKKYRGCSAPT